MKPAGLLAQGSLPVLKDNRHIRSLTYDVCLGYISRIMKMNTVQTKNNMYKQKKKESKQNTLRYYLALNKYVKTTTSN